MKEDSPFYYAKQVSDAVEGAAKEHVIKPAAKEFAGDPEETSPDCPGESEEPCIIGEEASSKSAAVEDAVVAKEDDMLILYIVGGIFGIIVIGSILTKYQALGDYTSFWARIAALALAGASGAFGSLQYSLYNNLACRNFTALGYGDCPALLAIYVMWGMAAFHTIFNLPFLIVPIKKMAQWYAKFGLMAQASVYFTVNGMAVAAIKYAGGDIITLGIVAGGLVVGMMFLVAWFQGEDGVIQRIIGKAEEAVRATGKMAEQALEEGLKLFGLDSNERSKLTCHNVYVHARVRPRVGFFEPGKNSDEEDLPVPTEPGEVVGFADLQGNEEGYRVFKGPGYAKVSWDQPGEGRKPVLSEHSIAEGSSELQIVDDEVGIVDKLVGDTMAYFGLPADTLDVFTGPRLDAKKRQVDIHLKYWPIGRGDKEDELGRPVPAAVTLNCEAYDGSGKAIGKVNKVDPQLYKSAIRLKVLPKSSLSILSVELHRLPDKVKGLVVSATCSDQYKLRHFRSIGFYPKGYGIDLAGLTTKPKSFGAEIGGTKICEDNGNPSVALLVMVKQKLGSVEGTRWFGVRANKNVGGRMPKEMTPVLTQLFGSIKDKVKNVKFRKGGECIDIGAAFDECEVHYRSEQRARETFRKHFEALTEKYAAKLTASGESPESARSAAQKYAALQLKQTKGVQFQALWKKKTRENIKMGMHPMKAQLLAKKAAMDEAMFLGRKEEVLQQVRREAEEEKLNLEMANKAAMEKYDSTWGGKISNWYGSWFGGEEDASVDVAIEEGVDSNEKKKKKKRRKRSAAEATWF
ncbi:hypothetical protein FOL47_000763 [Perkinsus chesapeaki]|uniref:Uncharacterized protein n=1 Tax=Perkinsus chesapeaki TaxID=330153 RepID=A0A7J6MLD3_PERCH|nr:hypothetical protein FOL47_000763 [Perkinsus chesapeaki]